MMNTPSAPTTSRARFTTSVGERTTERAANASTEPPASRMVATISDPIANTIRTFRTVVLTNGSTGPTPNAR